VQDVYKENYKQLNKEVKDDYRRCKDRGKLLLAFRKSGRAEISRNQQCVLPTAPVMCSTQKSMGKPPCMLEED
jgi:hypothetical protein